MPNPTEVAIIKRDGSFSLYSSYNSARGDAVDFDLIQIRADLTEQIVLKDKVDIWIMPGVVLTYNSGDTITDLVNNVSQEVHCKIYGEGIIKNTGGHSCLFIDHSDSELSIECDYIEGTSSGSSTFRSIFISRSSKFYLTCNKVLSKSVAIQLGSYASSVFNVIQDININIVKVETGDPSSTIIATSIVTYANGFINIDEILCKNRGHCFLHIAGSILSRIRKATTIRVNSNYESAINIGQIGQMNGAEKLTMYFDEIYSMGGFDAIVISEGTGIFIGRRVLSTINPAMEIVGINTKGYIRCNEMISQNANALGLNSFTEQITIDVNYLEGTGGGGVIYSADGANFRLKNAKLRNTYIGTSISPVGVFIAGGQQSINFENIKIVIDNSTSGDTIFTGGTPISIKNYGLFINKTIASSQNVSFQIGNSSNFLLVNSPDLT